MHVNQNQQIAKLLLTIAVCTHNRSKLMQDALHSIIDQLAPSDLAQTVELLVVDNASCPNVKAVATGLVQAAAPRGVRLSYLREDLLGLSMARNAALRAVDSKWIAFIDDDELIAEHWLTNLCGALATAPGDVGCFGGPMNLKWPKDAARPGWLTNEYLVMLSALDYGQVAHDVDPSRTPLFGGNLCISTEAVKSIGGFNRRMGRVGKNVLAGNEEVLLQHDLVRAGYRCAYLPDVVVHHRVLEERLSIDWMSRRIRDGVASDLALAQLLQSRSLLHAKLAETKRWLQAHGSLIWRMLTFSAHGRYHFAARRRLINARLIGAWSARRMSAEHRLQRFGNPTGKALK